MKLFINQFIHPRLVLTRKTCQNHFYTDNDLQLIERLVKKKLTLLKEYLLQSNKNLTSNRINSPHKVKECKAFYNNNNVVLVLTFYVFGLKHKIFVPTILSKNDFFFLLFNRQENYKTTGRTPICSPKSSRRYPLISGRIMIQTRCAKLVLPWLDHNQPFLLLFVFFVEVRAMIRLVDLKYYLTESPPLKSIVGFDAGDLGSNFGAV